MLHQLRMPRIKVPWTFAKGLGDEMSKFQQLKPLDEKGNQKILLADPLLPQEFHTLKVSLEHLTYFDLSRLPK